jgi:predicted enzyme related to lactoylglutathione lyase
MSTRDDPWPQGTPSWVDLSSPDPAASNAFYSALFGWEIQDSGPEMGNYGMCLLGGRPVAGIGPQMGGEAPPAWLTYLAVDDVEKTAEAIAPNGGTVVAPPMDVGPAGRMAVAQDPAGAFFGIWQAGETIGFERFNEPGSVVWNEAMSRDVERTRPFYAAVFGYEYEPVEGMPYWMLKDATDHRTVGGLGAIDPGAPAGTPAHWMTYFLVDDTHASAANAQAAGATLAQAPVDTPFGRMAVVVDPLGAMFSIMTAPEDSGTAAEG